MGVTPQELPAAVPIGGGVDTAGVSFGVEGTRKGVGQSALQVEVSPEDQAEVDPVPYLGPADGDQDRAGPEARGNYSDAGRIDCGVTSQMIERTDYGFDILETQAVGLHLYQIRGHDRKTGPGEAKGLSPETGIPVALMGETVGEEDGGGRLSSGRKIEVEGNLQAVFQTQGIGEDGRGRGEELEKRGIFSGQEIGEKKGGKGGVPDWGEEH